MRGALTGARHVRSKTFGKWREGDVFKVGRDEFVFGALVRDAATDRSWIEATYVTTGKKRNFNPDSLARKAKARTEETAFVPVLIDKAAPGTGKKRSRRVAATTPRAEKGAEYTVHPADWPTPTETTWRNGCRCEACKEAKREMNRRYRARGREVAYRQRKKVRRKAEKALAKGG